MDKRRWHNKKIEIGGLIYTIKYANLKDSKTMPGVNTKALLCTDTRTIYLARGMTPSEEIQSIIHEVIHGILDALIPAPILSDMEDIEEVLVEPFSRLLTSALRSAGLLRER